MLGAQHLRTRWPVSHDARPLLGVPADHLDKDIRLGLVDGECNAKVSHTLQAHKVLHL
jgi:hypothetical protein